MQLIQPQQIKMLMMPKTQWQQSIENIQPNIVKSLHQMM